MAARCRPAHWIFVEGDTAPGTKTFTVTGGLASLTTATATFSTRDADRFLVAEDVTATIGTVALESDGTYSCVLSIDIGDAELTTATGRQYGQFQVTYSDLTTITVPAAPILTIEVEPAYRLLSPAPAEEDEEA